MFLNPAPGTKKLASLRLTSADGATAAAGPLQRSERSKIATGPRNCPFYVTDPTDKSCYRTTKLSVLRDKCCFQRGKFMPKRGTVIKNRCFHIFEEALYENIILTSPGTLPDAPGTLPDAPRRSCDAPGRSWDVLGRSQTFL